MVIKKENYILNRDHNFQRDKFKSMKDENNYYKKRGKREEKERRTVDSKK